MVRTVCATFSMALVLGLATTAFAAQPPNLLKEYPDVLSLVPFSAPANYLSLPGYVRYRTYAKDGRWLSHAAAVHIVREEQGT